MRESVSTLELPYSLPPSPPPTAHPSPRLSRSVTPDRASNVTSLVKFSTSTPSSVSLLTLEPSLQRKLDDSDADSSIARPILFATRHSHPPNRALTLPPAATQHAYWGSPPKARPSSIRSSSSGSSSSSSSRKTTNDVSANQRGGVRRKVAATLNLFKETHPGLPADDARGQPMRSESLHSRHSISVPENEDASGPQFAFVKRAEWPDRESAAVRREKSSNALKRVRTRESTSSVTDDGTSHQRKRDSVLNDLKQWQQEVDTPLDSVRGRRRERLSDEEFIDVDAEYFDPTSSPHRPSSLFYPSPSPSRSPSKHRGQPFEQTTNEPNRSYSSSLPHRGHSSRSPTPVRAGRIAVYSEPTSPLPTSYSPTTTDDESGWETGSLTTSASTTSVNDYFPPYRHNGVQTQPGRPSSQSLSSLSNSGLYPFNAPDHDARWTFAESGEYLPHIPLQPFRNQVGGHSAIYKFTKRAVCKPLVSRENLFYESVEREAPPLLSFIPRYLGVMLVTYKTLPPHRLSTQSSRQSPARPWESSQARGDQPRWTSNSSPRCAGDSDTEPEVELPEVVLDRNRHIIPDWILRGGRHRAQSTSSAAFPGSHTPIRPQLHGGVASSPDIGLSNTPRHGPSPLAFPRNTEEDAPTPVNSPDRATRSFLPSLERASSTRLPSKARSDEDDFHRPNLQGYDSDRTINPCNSLPFFGGIGSTVVNTKLKDHVFSTVLRRFRRRYGGRFTPTVSVEDDGDMADAEDACSTPTPDGPRRDGKLRSQASYSRRKETVADPAIRRIHSDSHISSPNNLEQLASEKKKASEDLMDVFEMDMDRATFPDTHSTSHIQPSLRRRSRSRSLDSPTPVPRVPRPSAPPPQEEDNSIKRQNHFILMEDLTGRLKHPCVMDLKMGTRQYGMDATAGKKKSQRKKCDRTSSRSLGVRLCGMQVWNNVTHSYMTQDKYMGRDVKPEDFASVLASFLFNGEMLLVYHIPVLLQKIYSLARIINRLRGYRFYGCSLLLIYDGDSEAQDTFRSSAQEQPPSGRSKRGESMERRGRHNDRDECGKPILRRSHSEDLLLGPAQKRFHGRRKRGEVNLRLVDFAHTTTGHDWLPHPPENSEFPHEVTSSSAGYQADVEPGSGLIYARFPPHYPDEPDRGFLWGLKNLSSILEHIWNEERLRRRKAARDDPQWAKCQLAPLHPEGKDIFDEIFGNPELGDDAGMVST